METATDITLRLKRRFSVAREQVFRAWTNPEELQSWFHLSADWTTPIAEVDFRVGGRYRLGIQNPEEASPHVVTGVYKEINEPEKLVYTWRWEGDVSPDTLVTVHFHAQGNTTEVELVHERLPNLEQRDKHEQGWVGCLEQLGTHITI